jgi:hypothetical protein
MIERMVSDEQIYRDMCGPMSQDDTVKVARVLRAWADTLDRLENANDLRTVFIACIQTIGAMGPAYCRIAAATLTQRAKEFPE